MKRAALAVALLIPAAAAGANLPDAATKIEALKLGYELNGQSMVRTLSFGAIDLSGPPPESAMPKEDRLPLAPEPKKKKRHG